MTAYSLYTIVPASTPTFIVHTYTSRTNSARINGLLIRRAVRIASDFSLYILGLFSCFVYVYSFGINVRFHSLKVYFAKSTFEYLILDTRAE